MPTEAANSFTPIARITLPSATDDTPRQCRQQEPRERLVPQWSPASPVPVLLRLVTIDRLPDSQPSNREHMMSARCPTCRRRQQRTTVDPDRRKIR
jgi:hypothetical protein